MKWIFKYNLGRLQGHLELSTRECKLLSRTDSEQKFVFAIINSISLRKLMKRQSMHTDMLNAFREWKLLLNANCAFAYDNNNDWFAVTVNMNHFALDIRMTLLTESFRYRCHLYFCHLFSNELKHLQMSVLWSYFSLKFFFQFTIRFGFSLP